MLMTVTNNKHSKNVEIYWSLDMVDYLEMRSIMSVIITWSCGSCVLAQLITNDRFKSITHRVLAKSVGPRISLPSFFRTHFLEGAESRSYGPIKELLSEENPPVYKDINSKEYLTLRYQRGTGGDHLLSHFKLCNQVGHGVPFSSTVLG